jgi:photosystem II stability/assembly factor-like uncharacterized protein
VRYLGRNESDLLAGSDAGVLRSGDGGHTWKPSGIADRFVWDIVRSPHDPRVLHAVTEPTGLFESRDGGYAWTEIESFRTAPGFDTWCLPATPPRPARARTVVFDPGTPARRWVGVEVGGVVRTDDGGASWTCTLPGGNPDIHMIVRDPARPGVLFASTGFGRIDQSEPMGQRIAGVFRSDDGGVTWGYRWKGISPPYTRPLCVDQRPPHVVTVAAAPTAFSSFRDEGGAKAMLFQSADGGETWRSLGDAAHSPSAANFHAVIPDPGRIGGVLVGTDTGEVWGVTPDATWTLRASALPMVQALLGTE